MKLSQVQMKACMRTAEECSVSPRIRALQIRRQTKGPSVHLRTTTNEFGTTNNSELNGYVPAKSFQIICLQK